MKPVTEEHKQWVADQQYSGLCRDLAERLRDFAAEPRLQRMKLRADVLEMVTKLQDEQAHLVGRWD